MSDEELGTDEAAAITDEQEEPSEEQQQMAKLKEAIDVQVEEIGTLRKKLTITVPQATVAERRNDQFGEIKRDAVVPGFRKGHAPLPLVEKRFGQDVNEQLSSQLLSSSFMAASEKLELDTLGDPLIWAPGKSGEETLVTVEQAFDLITVPSAGDFSFSCEVEIRPDFELPPLEGIPIRQPQVKTTKADIADHIERLRGMRGHYQPVTDEPAQEDDLVVCNLKVTREGTVLYEEENALLAVRPQRYAGLLLENLNTLLSGSKIGDTRTFDVRVPDDYEHEAARGGTATAEVTLLDLKRLALPEIDAAFLESLGLESRAELEDWVKASLEARASEETARLQREQISHYLLERCPMELPGGLSQQQATRIAARRMVDLARRGTPESEITKQADAIRVGARADAIQDLQLQFILDKIGREWAIDVSEDEINGQIAAIAQRQNRRFDRVRDELIRNQSLTALYVHVRDEKIMDRLIATAQIIQAGEKGEPEAQPAAQSSEKEKASGEPAAQKTTGKPGAATEDSDAS